MNAVVCRESDPVSWPGFRNWVPKICPQMFTDPVGPVEVFFYWPKADSENFYWPRANCSLLVLSPGNMWSVL